MSFDIKKNLKLLIPKYSRTDLTTRRISFLAIVLPVCFGALALWFSYSKVSFSEKKYNAMFERLNETRQNYLQMRAQLDTSKSSYLHFENKLQSATEEYNETKARIRDSLRLQEQNIYSIKSVYKNIEQNFYTLQDSNRMQSLLLSENKRMYQESKKLYEESIGRLIRLDDSIANLKNSLQASKDSLSFAMANVELMKSSIESMAGEAAKIRPVVRSRTLFGHKDNHDRQLFEFAVWLDIPKELRKNISSVTYKFNLPIDEDVTLNKGIQNITVSDPNSDFKTSYTAWGCVQNMIIQVKFKSNYSTPIYFDLCRSLNNPLIEEVPIR